MKTFEPDWLTDELFLEVGFRPTVKGVPYCKYESFHPVAKKHIISGHNQYLGNGQRIIETNSKYFGDVPHLNMVIKCDGGTRTLFNGVITSKEDFLTIIKLID